MISGTGATVGWITVTRITGLAATVLSISILSSVGRIIVLTAAIRGISGGSAMAVEDGMLGSLAL